jgi:hypothetical protein
MSDPVEVVEVQDKVIKILSGAVTELFTLLSQHLTAEELDSLSVVGRVNLAAGLRAGLDAEIGGVGLKDRQGKEKNIK